jgi:hypothetical protein
MSQRCAYCSSAATHSVTAGPYMVSICDNPDCARRADEEDQDFEQDQYEREQEAGRAAFEDGYSRYGGPGRW